MKLLPSPSLAQAAPMRKPRGGVLKAVTCHLKLAAVTCRILVFGPAGVPGAYFLFPTARKCFPFFALAILRCTVGSIRIEWAHWLLVLCCRCLLVPAGKCDRHKHFPCTSTEGGASGCHLSQKGCFRKGGVRDGHT